MNKKNIFYIIIIGIILIGIIVTAIWGFNVNILYRNHQQVDIYIGKEFNNKDIKQIVKEVLNDKKIAIEKVEIYEDMVSINAKEITNEQLEQINEKINEKYEIENNVEELEIVSIPKQRIRDIIKEYVVPTLICTIIILAYTIIRYRKLGILKISTKILGIEIITQAIYFSIIAITRIQFGFFTIPGALVLATIILFIIFYQFEVKLQTNIEQSTKK